MTVQQYDVVVVGGSIAGSIFGERLANEGFKTLIVEATETPREKVCSGMQFPYFEKLIGRRIPESKLCKNELTKLYFEYPNGESRIIPFKMLNFERKIFDDWLNELAINSGAIFRDAVRCMGFKKIGNEFIIDLYPKHSRIEKVKTKYLVAADGLNSTIRKILRPQDFLNKSFAPTMNYYIEPIDDGDLNENTLYQFWTLDFSNMMFAWTYKKNDLWVVGTGHSDDFKGKCDLLLEYVKTNFGLKGNITRKEVFASKFILDDPEHVFLGKKNLLFLGDAAGLIDAYRGLGMDAAALSGIKAAKAVINAESNKKSAISLYKKSMRKIVQRIIQNTEKQFNNFENNEELLSYLKRSYRISGLKTMFANWFNKFLSPEKTILLPL